MDMCYPSTEQVAAQILAAAKRWKVADGNIFLATGAAVTPASTPLLCVYACVRS